MPGQRLSIVLCTYNGAAFLPQQPECLLLPAWQPDEIVIGDDVSTDDTGTILKAFPGETRLRGIEVKRMRDTSHLCVSEIFRPCLGTRRATSRGHAAHLPSMISCAVVNVHRRPSIVSLPHLIRMPEFQQCLL